MAEGFTIVEILIVVVILSIAAMTAIPMLSSGSDMQIRSASGMIAADLEYARSLAICRGQPYTVKFDKNTEKYWLEDSSNSILPHPVKKGFDYIYDFKNDKRLSSIDIVSATFNGNSTISFDSIGSPDNGGTITLNAGNRTVNIEVEPVTGFITITE